MKRWLARSSILFVALAVLTAGECNIGDLGDILDEPGQIIVTNAGTEPAVIAIIADDVKSYPTLAGGANASVQTNVGGRYQVIVVMTPESAAVYKAELLELRRNVEKLINGSTDSAVRINAFISLAGIKASIQSFEVGNGASCGGNIKLDADNKRSVNAAVMWVRQSGSGFWDLTCGSTN